MTKQEQVLDRTADAIMLRQIWQPIGGLWRRGPSIDGISRHSLRSAIFESHRLTSTQLLHSTDPMLQCVGQWRRNRPDQWQRLLQAVGIDHQVYHRHQEESCLAVAS